MPFDLGQTDKLLSTTGVVRKHLDLSPAVYDEAFIIGLVSAHWRQCAVPALMLDLQKPISAGH